MLELYIVERYGIHQQGIIGVYQAYGDAVAAAKKAKGKERDDYHSFTVKEIMVNETYAPDNWAERENRVELSNETI